MSDDELQARLGAELRAVYEVSPHLLSLAVGSFNWRTIDAELAELAFDSAEPMAAVRSTGANRTVVFTFRDVTVELAEEEEGRWSGRIQPAPDSLVLQDRDGASPLPIDVDGAFEVRTARGPIRFVLSFADHDIATDWIVV